ncbi:NAD(P)/FAD-dependent oxidoreductase [Nocardiopsis sp. NRRL B-16309]|uniref:NAD(P)/FAD-dependent oxidoreductase n=1 Tax=Nocardiopsis sp. NRRL B-16309 TaxID=1519494 RepID=UPI0006AFF1D0|nr:FAD-dependent oxidoreductase [Nocardiopsis sp. NRRL B-16309]KOX22171.1 hypothetical protein ADL05_04050 [Nocardiopsis sp. NRRL B-16309]
MRTTGDVVVVGGGMAAGHLVASMHRRGLAHRLTVLGAEPHPPYERPPLTKDELTGAAGTEPVGTEADLARRLSMYSPAWLAEQGVAVRVGARVIGIDRTRRTVAVDGGEAVSYRHLVLATGSRPVVPPPWAERPGLVHTVHTAADGARLRPLLREGVRLVVVGGGFVGLEVAAAARGRGCPTAVVEAGPRVLGRVCTPVTSAAVARLHEEHGVRVITGTRCVDVAPGEGGAPRVVRLADGTALAADLVVVGLGVRPETGLASAAGLEQDSGTGGIAVDDALRTTRDPLVSAVGDVAAFPRAGYGGRLRLESVGHASASAEHVAARLAGEDPGPYAGQGWVPVFWSDQYHHTLRIAGLSTGYDTTDVGGAPGEGPFTVRCLAGGGLLAVESLDRPRDHSAARRELRAAPVP